MLRGIAMVLMALDHTREFFAAHSFDIRDTSHLGTALFYTRWITHICAPIFVFLAGAGAQLQLQRGRSQAAVSTFLLTRGLWLVFLELTLMYLVWSFAPGTGIVQVIWALGWAMVTLAFAIWLPLPIILIGSLAIIAIHNLGDNIHAAQLGGYGWLWTILHEGGFARVLIHGQPHTILFVLYPLIPWNALMALGFCFGKALSWPLKRRLALTTATGALLLAIFAAVRSLNAYGDPHAWSHTLKFPRTAIEFMNLEKYPPSLLYLCATMGVAMLLFALCDWLTSTGKIVQASRFLEVFGRVPLAYFIWHIFLIHALALIVCAAEGLNWRWFISKPPHGSIVMGLPPGYGFSLPVVYLVWILVVCALYWPCRIYAGYKRSHPEKRWLSYL